MIKYKGFNITYVNRKWRALAYANPQFDNPNLSKLKKEINKYLKE